MTIKNKEQMEIKELWNEIAKRLTFFNKEITKLIGKKDVYGYIDINHDFLLNQWISFDYSEEITKEELKKVIELIEKYFGKLKHYCMDKRFKNERRGDGGLRWNTYSFTGYLKGYKGVKSK